MEAKTYHYWLQILPVVFLEWKAHFISFWGNICQMSSLNNHSKSASYASRKNDVLWKKADSFAFSPDNHCNSVCRSVLMHTSYFMIQNIKAMCTQRLTFNKIVSSRTLLNENLFCFLNLQWQLVLLGAYALFCGKAPAISPISASAPSVQIPIQWIRQIILELHYYENCFELADFLKRSQGLAGVHG